MVIDILPLIMCEIIFINRSYDFKIKKLTPPFKMSNHISFLNHFYSSIFTIISSHFLDETKPFPLCPYCYLASFDLMARIKNPKGPSKKVVPSSSSKSDQGSPTSSTERPAVPEGTSVPAPMAPSSSANRRPKAIARKNTLNVSPTALRRNFLASPTSALRDLNEDPSVGSDSESSHSSQEKVIFAPISARTRASVSSPKLPKSRKVVEEKPSSSKAKRQILKDNPPPVSSSKSSSEQEDEETEEDRSEYTPEAETGAEKSMPSLVEIEEELAAADPPSAPAEPSGKKTKSSPLPAKSKPSASKSSRHYQRKGKRSLPQLSSLPHLKKNKSTGITLENFQPYSKYFCYNDNERDMKLYEGRNMIAEKNFNMLGHKQYGVIHPLLRLQWMDTLEGFSGYVDRIVKEFYANLTEKCVDENSFMFERVYV